jgi:hypothetical protein
MQKTNKTHIIINNFFSDPDEIVKFAKKQTFYDKKNHPDKNAILSYPGHRTNFLHTHPNKEMYNKLSWMLSRAAQIFLEKEEFNADLRIAFSYTDKNVKMPQWHRDNTEENLYRHSFAGIVYLNKNVDPNTGTAVVVDNKGFQCSNEYNKLFMYDSSLLHSAVGSFGKDKKDSRLVLTFYFGILKSNNG